MSKIQKKKKKSWWKQLILKANEIYDDIKSHKKRLSIENIFLEKQ